MLKNQDALVPPHPPHSDRRARGCENAAWHNSAVDGEAPKAPLVDTHCHLYWEGLIERVEEVLARAREAQVQHIVVPGIDAPTSRLAQELAGRFKEVRFAAGLHPQEVEGDVQFESQEFFAPFIGDPKFVAVGEVGLDLGYRRTGSSDPALEAAQAEAFHRQVQWAAEHGLPVIVHNRDAGREIIVVLRRIPQARGVFHCFDGSRRTLQFLAQRDFFVSYAGNLTYRTAQNLRATLPLVPPDRMVVESDSPWLAPGPFRGSVNEPAHLVETVAQIAAVLEKSSEIVRINLLANSLHLFEIDRS